MLVMSLISMPSKSAMIPWRRRPRQETQEDDTTPTKFRILHLQLDALLLVLDFLPASSVVALALSCRKLWFSIGTTKRIEAIRRQFPTSAQIREFLYSGGVEYQDPLHTERQAFLILLQRDFEDLVFCALCHTLHGTKPKQHTRGYHSPLWQPVTDDGKARAVSRECFWILHRHDESEWFPRNLSFIELQMAMKRQSYGLDIKKLMRNFASIRHIEPKLSNRSFLAGHIRSQSTRISPAGIYLKEQQRFQIRRTKDCATEWPQTDWSIDVCNHQRITGHLSTLCRLELAAHCKVTSHPVNPFKESCTKDACQGLIQCEKCYTEIQLEINTNWSRYWEILITSWKDMGSIESVYDPKWVAHFRRDRYRSFDLAPDVEFQPGSIKENFEACEGPSAGLLGYVKRNIGPKHKMKINSMDV